ncbi:unnamed protein product [Ectocarpus sp. CCAP 1310/34]|nr:unnamed protein product [Ectocarpus sp. CCAP 1310/34]
MCTNSIIPYTTPQILIAEVADDGSKNGTLTATYKSDFPGDYLVYIDEVESSKKDEGVPILGSPFSLTIAGDAPTLDVNSLPVCSTHDDANKNIADTFWRSGTWLSSSVASAAHGVMRNGWVFQPKSCVFDTFSYEDLMLLASLDGEPTWLLVLGGSVQRGVFLTLIDMVLAAGQKNDIQSSVVQKCWGYADVRVGNLRLTYQEAVTDGLGRELAISALEWRQFHRELCWLRQLLFHNEAETNIMLLFFTNAGLSNSVDSLVCNNEKLMSGSTAAFIHSAEQFLASTIFREGGPWPTVVMAPSNLIPSNNEGTQFSVEEVLWKEENPTMTALEDVRMSYLSRSPDDDNGLGKMDGYETRDPRVSFMSVFPMYQAKLFENEQSKNGIRRFAVSQHFHYVSSDASGPETRNGTIMVHSTITEMLANVMIGRAVETKAKLYAKAAASTDEIRKMNAEVGKSFQAKAGTRRNGQFQREFVTVCSDCPSSLLPFHVKAIPESVCEIVESLPGHAKTGEAWPGDLCPDWCMKQAPVSQSKTESGVVEVRRCRRNTDQP